MPESTSDDKRATGRETRTDEGTVGELRDDLAEVRAEIPAPGTDPDSIEATAKQQLAAADPTHDERARDDLDRAARARALVAERNDAGPERVTAIDAELSTLGFDAPLPTTVAQRGDTRAPLGRQAPARETAAADPADAKPTNARTTSAASGAKGAGGDVDAGKPAGKSGATGGAKSDGGSPSSSSK